MAGEPYTPEATLIPKLSCGTRVAITGKPIVIGNAVLIILFSKIGLKTGGFRPEEESYRRCFPG
jgi:hypothetical protein